MPNHWAESEEYLPRVTIDSEAVKELESSDVDEIVQILGLTTDDILRAFPGHVYDYIGTHRPVLYQQDQYVDEDYNDGRHDLDVYQTDEDT